MSGKKQILWVDDEPALVEIGRKILKSLGYRVTTCTRGADALALFEKAPEDYDLVVTDMTMPGMTGIDLIKKIKVDCPDMEIMVHTVFDARDTVFAAIKAGASGYILKGASPRELIESIENLARGGAPMSPKIARAVIGEFQEVENTDQYLLTPREREILVELEKGLTYKELAEILSISHHTIHTHIKKIYEKLHAKSRRDALTTARKKGII